VLALGLILPRDIAGQDLPDTFSGDEILTGVAIMVVPWALGMVLIRPPEPVVRVTGTHLDDGGLDALLDSSEPYAVRKNGFFNRRGFVGAGLLSSSGTAELAIQGRDHAITIPREDVREVLDLASAAGAQRVARFQLALLFVGGSAAWFYNASLQTHELESSSKQLGQVMGALFAAGAAAMVLRPMGLERDHRAFSSGQPWRIEPVAGAGRMGANLGLRVIW